MFTFQQLLAYAASDPVAAGCIIPGGIGTRLPDPEQDLQHAYRLGVEHALRGYDPDYPECNETPEDQAYFAGYAAGAQARREAA